MPNDSVHLLSLAYIITRALVTASLTASPGDLVTIRRRPNFEAAGEDSPPPQAKHQASSKC